MSQDLSDCFSNRKASPETVAEVKSLSRAGETEILKEKMGGIEVLTGLAKIAASVFGNSYSALSTRKGLESLKDGVIDASLLVTIVGGAETAACAIERNAAAKTAAAPTPAISAPAP